ncbi:MAG: flavodoxin domain-containing protein [Candidatus Marinimicrobia bacterium]|nr:flavodoxin domain-containing protein [Candidatus Neomarinimicrobiota bacterium]
MKKLCITYETVSNTTKEIAEEIGHIAGNRGVIPDVIPLSAVENFDQYDAFVIGAPVHGMRWKTEATEFVKKHRDALKNVPVAYFLDAYMLDNGYQFWQKRIRKCLDPVSRIVKPVKTGLFGGRVPDPLPAPMRLIFGVKKEAPLDVRDENVIRTWAEELITVLSEKSSR